MEDHESNLAGRDLPILFTGENVGAIIAGRKGQTRRIVKPHQVSLAERVLAGGGYWSASRFGADPQQRAPFCPGDTLWVKERWRVGCWSSSRGICADYFDGPRKEWLPVPPEHYEKLVEQAQEDARGAGIETDGWDPHRLWEPGKGPGRWRSPMFMPRWASRLCLAVTGAGVQRLQEIGEQDAREEGVEPTGDFFNCPTWRTYTKADAQVACLSARESFQTLWNSINLDPKPVISGDKIQGFRCYPWADEDFDARYPGAREAGRFRDKPLEVHSNPLVWAYAFETVSVLPRVLETSGPLAAQAW